jgi:23S rRNA pseudouridine1911/1915/1917 synthase
MQISVLCFLLSGKMQEEDQMCNWIVEIMENGLRLDVFLAEKMNISRAEAQRLISGGNVWLDNQPPRNNHRMRAGENVQAVMPDPVPSVISAQDIPLAVIYEDEDILVVNKPRGMVVHPAPGNPDRTLVNAVLAHADNLSGIGGIMRPGIVHRLDKDTSGLLVIAKNDLSHISLQFQKKTAERRYIALLWGRPAQDRMILDAPIGRNPTDRKKMAIVLSGGKARQAQTEISVREVFGGFSLVEASLRTGRTHQIRVHCSWIGHPVVGDPLYGGERKIPGGIYSTKQAAEIYEAIKNLNGQALHAFRLSFQHPRNMRYMEFEAPMPDTMQKLMDLIRSFSDRF